jgi:ubiquinone/menaquinone biosynthesis C-methylase UbiE
VNQHLTNAFNFHLKNEFQSALEIYSAILKIESKNIYANHFLGILLIQNGLIDQGLNHINLSIQSNHLFASEADHNLKLFSSSIEAKYSQDFNFYLENDPYRPRALGTVNDWRHLRMLEFTACFKDMDLTWLTIGDHYGHDALLIKDHGNQHVTPSSLNTSQLLNAQKLGLIDNFLCINAEKIELADNSFDYVVCKEALHHMPRPYMAIYEMLRVARKGFCFIEPSDPLIDWSPGPQNTLSRKIIDNSIVGKSIQYLDPKGQEIYSKFLDWWEDGAFNYVYTMSKREVSKISQGLGIPSYATFGFNDIYREEWSSQVFEEESDGYKNTIEQITLHDQLCSISGMPQNYVTGILFKETPPPSIIQNLSNLKFEFQITRTRYIPLKWPKLS